MNDAKRQPQLLEQLDQAEKLSAVCHELARSLNERLNGVLRQEAPTPPQNAQVMPVKEPLVPAAERVRACAQNSTAACTVIQSILDRLEA